MRMTLFQIQRRICQRCSGLSRTTHYVAWRMSLCVSRLAVIIFLGMSSVGHASHYEVITPDDNSPIQCLVQDIRYPQVSSRHYLACFSQHFRTKEGWGGYFYGGFVGSPKDERALLQFCSWQMSGKGVPAADIFFTHAGKNMSWARTTWEGCAGGIKGHWPDSEFMPNQWHRFVARTWSSAEDPEHSYIGIWFKIVESGVWHHLATTRYPGVIDNLGSFYGFQENFAADGADPVASVDLRNTYSQRNGVWVPANTILFRTQGKGEYTDRLSLRSIEGGKAVSLRTLWDFTRKATPDQKNDTAFKPANQELTYQQPPQPTFFDPVIIDSLSPITSESQVYVKWDLAPTSCPQLGYKLEIFDSARPQGEPMAVLWANDPECRSRLVDLKSLAAASVRLTVTDIYGRDSTSVTKAVEVASLQSASKTTTSESGLNYCYFEAPEGVSWNQLPDFTKIIPTRQGAVTEPDISPRLRRSNYAFDFKGQLTIDSAGIYDFTLVHASGGKLTIDGLPVIDAGDYHSIGKYSGAISLDKGPHAFHLQYVQGDKQFQQADDFLQLLWTGPGSAGNPVRIPIKAYSRPGDKNEPTIAFMPAAGAVGNRVKLTTEVSGIDGMPHRVQYYIANPAFDYFSAQGARGENYFICETKGANLPLEAMLWGTSEKTIRARLLYGDNRTIDSAPAIFKTTPASLGPWKLTELEHHQYPVAAFVDGQSVSLLGESMSLLTQPVTGDCTLIARLADITPRAPGPDGTLPDASQWQAGIILRNDLGASPGEPLGGNTHYVALLGSVDGAIRHCDSLMKDGAGNQPSGDLGGGNRWLKLERKGDRFTEYISDDGKTWKLVKAVHLPKMNSSIHAGLFIYALPSAINLLHHAHFDNVSLKLSGL